MTLLGPIEIADMLGVPRSTVRSWHHRGQLPRPLIVISDVPIWRSESVVAWAQSKGKLSCEQSDWRKRAREESSRAEYACTEKLKLPSKLEESAGNYDDFRGLHPKERIRLRKRWMSSTGEAPDQLEMLFGSFAAWLDLTRRADMGRARTPDPDAYGGFTLETMFGVSEQVHESVTPDCVLGPSPADMTVDDWLTEVRECSLAAIETEDGWSTTTSNKAWARLCELAPPQWNLPNVYDQDVYRTVCKAYATR